MELANTKFVVISFSGKNEAPPYELLTFLFSLEMISQFYSIYPHSRFMLLGASPIKAYW